MPAAHTSSGVRYQLDGPAGGRPVVLVHAGVADRRMWDPIWPALTADRPAIRLDLTGFGESATRPDRLDHVADLLGCLAELEVASCDLVGASYGAGVAVEAALTQPAVVNSLLLVAPGGSLIAEATPQLREFFAAERAALADHDLDGAVEANLRWWLDGPHRPAGAVTGPSRKLVGQMQRLAFELTADWDELPEQELDPPALERLDELAARTLVVTGGLDLDAIGQTADRLCQAIPGARRVDWPDVAHLPSLERPNDFLALLRDWLAG